MVRAFAGVEVFSGVKRAELHTAYLPCCVSDTVV